MDDIPNKQDVDDDVVDGRSKMEESKDDVGAFKNML